MPIVLNHCMYLGSGRLWQRSYNEHVIRDEASLDRIPEYIITNPAQWGIDRENPAATAAEPRNMAIAAT